MDGAVDVLQICRAEELSLQGQISGDLGDVDITAMSFDGDHALDAMQRDGRIIVIDVQGHVAGDAAHVNIAVVCGDRHERRHLVDGYIAMIGLNRDGR